MRLCLSGRIVETLQPRPSLDIFAGLAAECGYDGVTLRPWQLPRQHGELAPQQVTALLRERRLVLAAALIKDRDDLEAALALGVRVLRCSDTAALQPLVPKGVRLGPQMHTNGPYETIAAACAALRDAPPGVGVFVEPGNLVLAGETFSKAMLLPLRGRLIGCNFQSIETGHGDQTLKLADGRLVRYTRVPAAANSQLPLRCFLRALAAAGYDDFINVIEPAATMEEARRTAAGTVQALRRALAGDATGP